MFAFRPPMLCKSIQRDDLDSPKWSSYTAEPKHDGVRCLVVRDLAGVVRLYSRTGNEFTDHVPRLVGELEAWVAPGAVVDGELAVVSRFVVLGGETVPVTDFNATMRVLGSKPDRARSHQDAPGGPVISFIAYDLLAWGGSAFADKTHVERRDTLRRVLDADRQRIILNPSFADPSGFGDLFDNLVRDGIEGIVIKNRDAAYVFDGRPNKVWYKVKAAVTIDLIVSGYTEGGGKYEGLVGAVEFSRMGEDGGLVKVGRCSGMTDAVRRDISANRDQYLGCVIEVKSNELVGSGEYRTPRHPQFVAFRFDKNPQECLGDELRAASV